jgi:hypothetical protein
MEEREAIAKEIEVLLAMGVYQPVPQTPQEEETQRDRVRSGQWDIDQKESRSTTSGRPPTALRSPKSGSAANLYADSRRKWEADHKADDQCAGETHVDLQAQIFYSDVFLKQEELKRRVLHDLKRSGANPHARQNTVKQDGVKALKGQISDGDRFVLFDLRKAFFQVLILARLRAMLRTMVALRTRKGSDWEWTWVRLQYMTLSQGLCVAPEIMTKLMADVLRVFRKLGFRVLIKIDDLVAILPSDLKTAMAQAFTIMTVLCKLGAVFSAEKCEFNFSTRVVWHGHAFCSVTQICSLPGTKVTKLVQLATMNLRWFQDPDSSVSVRQMSQMIGSLIYTIEGVDAARIMVIELQMMRRFLMQSPGWDWDRPTSMTKIPARILQGAVEACLEWITGYDPAKPHQVPWNGRFMFHDPPVATVFTDACEWQRGVWVEEDKTNSFPTIDIALPLVGQEIYEHITLQETAAAADGIVETIRLRNYRDCSIVSRIDATAAVKYIKCFGGRLAPFTRRVKSLQQICRDRHIALMVSHVKGELNPADAPSRRLVGMAEFKLNPFLFHNLNLMWGPFGLDACAASWNQQLPRYLSRQLGDPDAIGQDILTFPIQDERDTIYIFPPPHQQLLVNILQRIKASGVQAVLIMPTWPTAAMGMALRMAVDLPVLLECNEHLLFMPMAYRVHIRQQAQSRPWWTSKTWRCMTGVRLSGHSDNEGVTATHFQQTLPWSTKTPAVVGADILMGHSACLWPVSEKSRAGALLLSQMLLSVT